ncbi:hypothetical protein F5883DRAFT_610284 [Diaporthe sp. PMI_573]|nr:hypothetical protein F5883DRAFT_610284 [Diaporthaceae sp. PMI_573]
MRAVVWQGNPYDMAVLDVPRPTLYNATDAIIRITHSAICGTDLHVYHGIYGSTNAPWIMGHEAVGIVDAIGDAVNGFSVGDHVIIPDSITSDRSDVDASAPLAFGLGDDYGPGLGGLQAEYVRVPFATNNLIPIPQSTSNTTVSDAEYLYVGDIWSTAWVGVSRSGFEPGDTIAIFGSGPVGLLAAYSAVLRGASRVYVIDYVADRLERAAFIADNVISIDFTASDPVQQILAYEPNGVHRAVDCIGWEAVNANLEHESNIVLRQMVEVVAHGGGIGGIGIYNSQTNSTGAPLGPMYPGTLEFPAADFFTKGLQWITGPVDITEPAAELVRLISSGFAKPSFIVSAEINIEQAPEYFRRFNDHEETKVIINF